MSENQERLKIPKSQPFNNKISQENTCVNDITSKFSFLFKTTDVGNIYLLAILLKWNKIFGGSKPKEVKNPQISAMQ